ncbi:MAG: methyltransferase domain-containing protein [Rubrivivax sp.]|nr:methyltransferase domain-containing protein [Rubrivivax sp.]
MSAAARAPAGGRSIADYQRAYLASDFEPVQARMRKRMLLALLARHAPRRVLEVGCGTDALFRHWSDFDRFVVVEPGELFAAKARRDAEGDARILVVEDFVENAAAALRGEGFDLVLVSGLLHEVPDPAALLRALRPLCGEHTLVHVNVPNARSLHRLLALEMGLITDLHELSDRQRALQQPRTFDLEQLRALCTGCGFAEVDAGSYFVKPFSHAQMARLQHDGLVDERLLQGLYGLARHLPDLGSEIFVNLRTA